jgi:hypothetical protein
LKRWKNYLSQLLNVDNVSDVSQIEVHTAGPLVPGPSRLEVEISIAKLKKYKSLGSDQIPAELCINETYSKVRIGKRLSDSFSIKNDLKQGDALSTLLFNFALEYAVRNVLRNPGGTETKWDTSASGLR